ncbi:Transcriptional regulatory protein pro-1 [Termitomyces sp. T112]|nr:Transcriptional regulatory protein pro-1 [Termitomyces sp. T112]
MPVVKSSSNSKRGVPKQKGAVRAKSGCYTCRIRRKKCDERPDGHGRCMTCIRLRLECLGFGAKRPEWLRESRNVAEVREKIKIFLASQGMIKGHSGTGPRGAETESPTLHLRAEEYSESSESPPTPTLSLTDTSRPHHMISSIRGDPYSTGQEYAISSNLYSVFTGRDHSPFSQESVHDTSPYQLSPIVDNNLSLVVSPALASSFGPLYHFNATEDMMGVDYDTATYFLRNPEQTITHVVDEMLTHYRERVVKAQYLFADTAMRDLICEIVMSHTPSRAREAASLLSSVHWQRFQNPNASAFESTDTQYRLAEIQNLLNRQDYSSDDAMAALHVISSYLFDGGGGNWEWWLETSCRYVDHLFSRYHNPAEALMRCTPKDVFIIKTSIWFDVLASVTTQRSPHFLQAIRSLFSPIQSKIEELDAEDSSSMMSPMGCHNQVVWALAETSHLFCWKQRQLANESLSIPTLVRMAAEIEEYLQPPVSPPYCATNMNGCRALASEIFRASARLYLRVVVSGDHPHVEDIKESVQDTISYMQFLNCSPSCSAEVNGQTMSRSIVRNTVFGFFLCGAFSEQPDHRELIQSLLDREGDGAGNGGSIRHLLHEIWEQRDAARRQHSSTVVNWRHGLARTKILLV